MVLWTSPRQHDFFSVFLRCMFPRLRSADKLIHVKQAVCYGIQFRMGHVFTNRRVFRSAAENSEIRRINYGRFCIQTNSCFSLGSLAFVIITEKCLTNKALLFLLPLGFEVQLPFNMLSSSCSCNKISETNTSVLYYSRDN